MIAALALAAAATAVDAERAFAARAQAAGQWRAFADYAADGAVMMVPEPVDAHAWLVKQREAPRSVEWAPAESYVSCDGATAVNTGPFRLTEPRLDGFFTTVWREGSNGWKWLYDGGAPLATPRAWPGAPRIERASCDPAPVSNAPPLPAGGKRGGGASRDRSLLWSWQVDADGTRHFTARLWTGSAYRTVVSDVVAAR